MTGRLIFFWAVIFSGHLWAQPANDLFRFTREKTAPDGQNYIYSGMRNSNGDVIIPALFDYIWDFRSDTLTLARKLNWDSGNREMFYSYQIITRNGFLLYELPPAIEPVGVYDDLILCLNRRSMLYGYIDKRGNTVIKFKYSDAGAFSEGLAFAEHPGTLKKGYIDKSGKWIIQPVYDKAFNFSEGHAVTMQFGKWYFIDKIGGFLSIPGKYSEIGELHEGLAVVSRQVNDSLLFGCINKSGTEVIPPTFEFLDNFLEGTSVFLKKGRAGMVDNTGKILIPPYYDELYRYDQRHYIFALNDLQGLIRLDGKVILPAKYSSIGFFSEGLCPVKRSGNWGFADTSGQEFIPCQFSEIKGGFAGGKATVKLGDKWWMATGKDTLELPAYDEVLPYFGQVAPFRYKDLWGFLNIHGEESTGPVFDELIFNKNGLIYGRKTMADSTFIWSVFSNTGKLIADGLYIEVIRSSEGYSAVKTRNGWGFIDPSGIPVCSPHYTAVRNFSENRAAVQLNGEWGFIDEHGTEVIPVYAGKPLTDKMRETLQADTVQGIRESFPLFSMVPEGDYKNNCTCVRDLLPQANNRMFCMNRIGKTSGAAACEPYLKLADQLNADEFDNRSIQVIRLEGSWIEINTSGEKVN
jgi:hypothetical protein